MRQKITESVMKESAAELAKGIQHRQEIDNAISACKLKQRADYLVENSKRESKENDLFHSAKDLATASRVTLKATHKSNLATTNSQDKSLQIAIKATDAAGFCWRKNVRKIVSDT